MWRLISAGSNLCSFYGDLLKIVTLRNVYSISENILSNDHFIAVFQCILFLSLNMISRHLALMTWGFCSLSGLPFLGNLVKERPVKIKRETQCMNLHTKTSGSRLFAYKAKP